MTSEDYLIGRRIQRYREDKGLTRAELASKIGVSSDRLYNWETGRSNIYADYLGDISDGLEVDINDLLGRERSKDMSHQAILELYDPDRILNRYYKLTDPSKEIVDTLIEHELSKERNKLITFMPMLSESSVPMMELDYYSMPASAGTGQYVENAIPERINIPAFEVPDKTDFVISVSGDSMEPTFSSGDKLYVQATKNLKVGDIGVFNINGEEFVKELGENELISHNKSYLPIKVHGNCYVQGKVLGKV